MEAGSNDCKVVSWNLRIKTFDLADNPKCDEEHFFMCAQNGRNKLTCAVITV